MTLLSVAVLGALMATGPAVPVADPPQISLFSERFYRGEVQRFTANQPRIAPAIEPQSVMITGRWEVCTEPDFAGNCIEIDRSYPVAAGLDGGFRLRSLRRLAAGAGASKPAVGVQPGGASLAGVASRYWLAPTYGSERVLACVDGKANLNCAHDTAEALCRRAGFRQVRYWQLETVAGRSYLADVLCVRSED